jgi:hypothetical protein
MSCDGGHLGFPIGIKNRNLVKDIPMIIHLQFGFSQFINFREEDLWNFSQSEHIIGPGSHIGYPTGTKNSNFVEDHPRNIPAKFGSNRPSGFREEPWNVKSLQTTDNRRQTTDDGRQVMAIVHLDQRSRWTKKGNNSKMGNQIYLKIAGYVDLDMLNMFAVSTYHLSLIVFEIKTKSIKILKIWWKKGNNSKMGNGIYFKIAGCVDLDIPHIFAI